MAHKRCTGCKEEVGRFGIRHKYAGGVFCEQCMRAMGIRRGRVRGFWGRIWDWATDLASSIFHPEAPERLERKRREAKIQAHYQAMKVRALSIPPNPASGAPQKR